MPIVCATNTSTIRVDWCFWNDGDTKLWEHMKTFDSYSEFLDWQKTDEGAKLLNGCLFRLVVVAETVMYEQGELPTDV